MADAGRGAIGEGGDAHGWLREPRAAGGDGPRGGGGLTGIDERAEGAAWCERCRPALVEEARRLARDRAAAEDLVQEAFLRALSIDAPKEENGAAWLCTLLRHRFIDGYRHRRADPLAGAARLDELPDVAADEPQEVERGEMALTAEDVAAALGRLPATFAEPFRLFHVERLSYAAIASRLEVPQNTVRSRIRRARRRLRKLLERKRLEETAEDGADRAGGGRGCDFVPELFARRPSIQVSA